MQESVVTFDHVSRQFDATEALKDITLSVPPGCVFGLVGTNGAGKTTLIKHILGLLRAKQGTVRVFGLDPVRNPVEVLRRIGYLSEERDLPDWMRLDELCRYTRAYYPTWDQLYAETLLERFGLDPKQKVKNLSRGMRAQAGLIVAVAHRPDLLLLDEPSSGLDTVVRLDILGELVRAVADEGRTALFSSHLLDEVERASDYIAMLHQGRVILNGPLDDIKQRHQFIEFLFDAVQAQAPKIEGALWCDGSERAWKMVCNGAAEKALAQLQEMNCQVISQRNASLEEIFVAYAGHK